MTAAEVYFKRSVAFMKTGGPQDASRSKWISDIGVYYWYSLILAEFDPVKAGAIFDQPADVIAVAYVSKMAYEYNPE